MNNILLRVYTLDALSEYYISNVHDEYKVDVFYEDKEYIIKMSVINGSWCFKESNFYKVTLNGRDQFNIAIEEAMMYDIKTTDGRKISTIWFESIEKSDFAMQKYKCSGVSDISIGTSESCMIQYSPSVLSGTHSVITFNSGKANIELEDSSELLYINGQKAKSSQLKFGDEISIYGLKIVYLGEVLAINRPRNFQKCKLPNFITDSSISRGSNTDKADKEKAYFQRSPRIEKSVEAGQLDLDEPPAPQDNKDEPLLITLGPSFTMGMATMGSFAFTAYQSKNNPQMLIPGMIMTASMLAGAILWPIVSRGYRKVTRTKEENRRIKRYRKYMKKQFEVLAEKIEKNKKILSGIYPDLAILINRAENKDRRLWERTPSNQDFLDIRVGKGTVSSHIYMKIPNERFTMTDDPLIDELKSTNKDYLSISNVPISIPLMENNLLGVIGDRKKTVDIAKAMMIQISALHSYDEVKIICLYNKKDSSALDWTKNIPHVWGPEKAIRFAASSKKEAQEVFLFLKEVLTQRQEESKDGKEAFYLPYFVLFVFDQSFVEDEPVINYLTHSSGNLGFSTVFVYDKINDLPKECKAYVQANETETNINYTKNNVNVVDFEHDTCVDKDLDSYARALASIKVKESASALSIPTMLTFLEMLGAGNIDQLEIKRKWIENMSSKALMAPIGIKAGGSLFSLNIHDKYHGAHGLIAGMTGSGKSEFIQSFILALALNYHPHDVSFILIDYKGGGMANCFEGLPHISGTITNLGGSQVMRSLVSLKSELKRRQRLFGEYKVNHIDLYQQLYKENMVSEPLPHLVIISDEFAELKDQQPEFMDELVTTARIGRSLGVHLILATQKPYGVVSDQIWSNSKFRICLKVLDKSDSNSMLSKPDAAYITQPGRCYVQVGNDEIYELMQTGYSGAEYNPTDKIENIEDKQIQMIDTIGNVLKTVSIKNQDELNIKDKPKNDVQNTQIANIVNYINKLAERDNIKPLKLWLEPLREIIYLNEVEKRSGGWNGQEWVKADHWLSPVVGLVDDPRNQNQRPLVLNIGQDGGLILYGTSGTGKTTFLQTLAYSLVKSYSPDEINLYFMDFGGRTMGYFNHLPHTGGVIFSDEEEKLDKLFKMLSKELERRRRLFAKYNVGTIKSYMEVTGESIPAMIVFLDKYNVFMELYLDYFDYLTVLSRDGLSYGIFIILTVDNASSLNYKITQNFKTSLTLQLVDKYDYVNVLGKTEGIEPDNVKGRGLVRLGDVLEYQTALAIESNNESDRIFKLSEIFKDMDLKWAGRKAREIPCVPEKPVYDEFINNNDVKQLLEEGMIPVAYDLKEAEIVSIDLKGLYTFTILGQAKTGKTNIIKLLSKLIREVFNWKVYMIEGNKDELEVFSSNCGFEGYMSSSDDINNFIDGIAEEMVSRFRKLKAFKANGPTQDEENDFSERFPKIFVFVDDIDAFAEKLSEEAAGKLENIINDGGGLGIYYIVSINSDNTSESNVTQVFGSALRRNKGMLVGTSIDDQRTFEVSNMDYKQKGVLYDPGMGYLISRKEYHIIKVPIVT